MKTLVLAGGGHSHVGVLRALAHAPLRNLSVTLISPDPVFTYSGMVPGVVAGHYTATRCQIDLRRLCTAARVEFAHGQVTALDAGGQRVETDTGAGLSFDMLSLDVGSAPDMSGVPGASDHAVPVRPLTGLVDRWTRWTRAQREKPGSTERVIVVGGGAGGVELAMAMAHALGRGNAASQAPVTIVTDAFVTSHPARVRDYLRRALQRLGVPLLGGRTVVRVDADGVTCASGERLPATLVVWATAAAAPSWLRSSGLDVDERGFVIVNRHLQSTSHPRVFAVGDVAMFAAHPLPKAGVFAVRQAGVLEANLRRYAAARPLVRYRPQRRWLSLISLGERRAVGSYGALAWEGAWVWRLKDVIDRRFVGKR